MRLLPFLLLVHFYASAQPDLLKKLLSEDTSAILKKVLEDTSRYRLQIIYTEVFPGKNILNGGKYILKTHAFRNNPNEYFFPASLVKLPVAILTLEKLNTLKIYGIKETTPFSPLSDFQCMGRSTKSAPLSAYDLIHKIFVYSDNAAFNYLYELCGQEFLHRRLQELGYTNTRIVEKISRCGKENNRKTGPIAFFEDQKLFHIEGEKVCNTPLPPNISMKVGKGYLWNGKYVASPRDFSSSNCLPLQDAHHMLVALVMPQEVDKNKRFNITEAQKELMLGAMSMLPSKYCPDSCHNHIFKDNHVKYLMGQKDTIPTTWKIYNKVGLAHGFMSDCTYFEDKLNEIRFFLSAVIYVNEDEIVNDGKYDYNTIGFPFLKRLGKLVYDYELKKKEN